MKNFKFDFAKYGNTIPMIDFLDSLTIKERAFILKNIEKFRYEDKYFFIPRLILDTSKLDISKLDQKYIDFSFDMYNQYFNIFLEFGYISQ